MASTRNIAVVEAALEAAVSVQLSIVLISMSLSLLLLSFLVGAPPETERHEFREDE